MAAESAESSGEDVEFLRDQVHRLNAVLSAYQKKYPGLSQEDEKAAPLAAGQPHAPWLTDRRLLAPLLTEYDAIIQELNQQLSLHQTELGTVTSQVQKITDENTRLHSELRKSLEVQLQAGATASERRSAPTAVSQLQQQLDILSQERDSYVDLWKQTSVELTHLKNSEKHKSKELLKCKKELAASQQAAMSAQRAAEELQAACQRLDKEHQEVLRTAQAQDEDLSRLQEQLTQCRAELKAAATKNSELKRSLDEITLQLKKREVDRQRGEDHEQSLDDRIHHLHITTADLEGKLLAAQREAALLQGERTDLEHRAALLQSKVSQLEQREYDAIMHVKESMQLVENAMMDKEQHQIREQQHVQEVSRLKRALAMLLEEAGKRTSEEVAIVREECGRNIDKMAVEIEKLERECGEWQVQLERALREKKAVEKELERAFATGPLQHSQAGEALHELQSRVCAADRTRDDALLQLENEVALRKRAESSLLEEKCACEQLVQERDKWQKDLAEESQSLREQRIQLTGLCDELHQRLRTSEQARENAERRLLKEVTVLSQRFELREKELLSQLDSTVEGHQRSTQELREMLVAQHRIGTRWREESREIAQKYEATITELREDVTRQKRSNEKLAANVNHLKLAKDDLSRKLEKLSANQSALHQQLIEADSRAETATEQVAALLTRERQLLEERRELQKQLDQIRLQAARNTRVQLAISGLPKTSGPNSTRKLSSNRAPPSPFSTALDTSKWNTALSDLRHSIHQVRQDLDFSTSHHPLATQPREEVLSRSSLGPHNGGSVPLRSVSPEDASERSTLTHEDLSILSRGSHHSHSRAVTS